MTGTRLQDDRYHHAGQSALILRFSGIQTQETESDTGLDTVLRLTRLLCVPPLPYVGTFRYEANPEYGYPSPRFS